MILTSPTFRMSSAVAALASQKLPVDQEPENAGLKNSSLAMPTLDSYKAVNVRTLVNMIKERMDTGLPPPPSPPDPGHEVRNNNEGNGSQSEKHPKMPPDDGYRPVLALANSLANVSSVNFDVVSRMRIY